MKEAVNILLEIYGVCYIFDGEIQLDYSSKRQRCNWKMLPPGEMPSRHIKKQLGERGEKIDTYDIFRLEYMEKYNSEKIVEGINGFKGYYAFIFSKCCVLESAIYGNATYIIPKENWEILSQKTKKTSVYKGYKQDKIEMRGDRAEMSDFPLYLNTVAGGLDRRDQTIGGFSFVVKIDALPVVEIIG